MTKCEGCGSIGSAEYIKIHVTNGALTLCRQCLDDINRKNPEVAALRAMLAECREYITAYSSDSAILGQLRYYMQVRIDAAMGEK